MTKLEQAARQALGALEVATTPLAKDRQEVLRAITTLREALSGVQALSAGPGASRAAPPSTYVNGAGIHAEDGASTVIRKLDARFHDIVTFKAVDAAASPTPPAEQHTDDMAVDRTGCTAGTDEECTRRGCATSCPAQQAAPKAAPAMTPETVYAAIAHGDQDHRAWLLSALRAVWCGEAVPPVSSPIADAAAAPQPAPAPLSDEAERDAAFDAVRKKLCALPRFSFLSDVYGVRRVPDKSGSWIAFDAAHAMFDPVAVDAALAAQGGKA